MKKCVFTINFGGYDRLREPLFKTDGWDYIVFTNNDIKSEGWEVRKVDLDMTNHHAARHVYINSNLYLSEYDYSIMVGGQIEIKGDMDKFVKENFDLSKNFNLMKHPCRACIFDEANLLIKETLVKGDGVAELNDQMHRYKFNGMPTNFGLSACGIIGRHHNTEVKKFERIWWNELYNGICRDQLSFDYLRWKLVMSHHWFPTLYWDLLHGEYFDIYRHGVDRFA